MTIPIVVIQGGQWGSEAKGAIAAYLCLTRDIDIAVRTGAINAGHTVAYKGERYAMQQLPTGWVNPNTKLVIGAGAYIHPETLWREIDMVNKAMPESDVRDRLYIDFRCGLHSTEAEAASKSANRHHSIGATGKGCSEAVVAKISKRNAGYQLFYESPAGQDFRMRNRAYFIDTVAMMNKAYDHGARLLIEGTQGTLLDLHLGPYPYTTSRMTTAANWVAEAGLSPALDYEVVLVCRTYPIRVAGNSGPMSFEIEWTQLAASINKLLVQDGLPPLVSDAAITEFTAALDIAAADAIMQSRYQVPIRQTGIHSGNFDTQLSGWSAGMRNQYRAAASELHKDALTRLSPESLTELKKLFEMTTVTKKLRRIACLSHKDLQFAVQVNRPSWACFTFMDYLEPVLRDFSTLTSHTPTSVQHNALDRVQSWCESTGNVIGCPVKMVSFGPTPDNVVQVREL